MPNGHLVSTISKRNETVICMGQRNGTVAIKQALKILQYDYTLLSLHILLLYEILLSKNPETIVIVSTGCSNIGLL